MRRRRLGPDRLGPDRLDAEGAWIARCRAMVEARYDRLGVFLARTREG